MIILVGKQLFDSLKRLDSLPCTEAGILGAALTYAANEAQDHGIPCPLLFHCDGRKPMAKLDIVPDPQRANSPYLVKGSGEAARIRWIEGVRSLIKLYDSKIISATALNEERLNMDADLEQEDREALFESMEGHKT